MSYSPLIATNIRYLFDFESYTRAHYLSLAAFCIAITFAVVSLKYFLSAKLPGSRPAFVQSKFCVFTILFWTLVPPTWFFFEYFILWRGAPLEELTHILNAQKLAQPFWAAVLATLLFLVPK